MLGAPFFPTGWLFSYILANTHFLAHEPPNLHPDVPGANPARAVFEAFNDAIFCLISISALANMERLLLRFDFLAEFFNSSSFGWLFLSPPHQHFSRAQNPPTT